VAATARVLGLPLIPWQQQVADVCGEVDARGRLHYLVAVVVVPRRAGKTHIALTRALTLTRRRRTSRAFYAAHRRETAAAMWRDQWFPMLEDSPLSPRFVTLRRANGSEAMTWRHSRSVFRLLPPDGDAMRSFASDLAVIDEAREFSLDAGLEYEAACFPTQRTGLGGQTVILSNAGTATAGWLRRWRDLGRAATANPASRVAYFEWGAPEGADPDDDATLIAAHPGVGYHVDLDALRADREVMPPDDYATEYLGWWPEGLVDTELVDAWDGAARDDTELRDPIVLALELNPDRTLIDIVAVGREAAGGATAELAVQAPHDGRLVATLERLVDAHRPVALVWDAAGPVAALAHDLDGLRVNLEALGTRDVVAASGQLYDTIRGGALAHRPDPALTAAVAAARRRTALGAWVFDRRQPGAGPLLAMSLGLWVFRDRTHAAPTVR
jgi:hypothetical protein